MVALYKKKPWRISPSLLRFNSGFDAVTNTNIDTNSMGILAFEAARTMSRLLSLRGSLSASELARLRASTMRSPGVSYLNSADQLPLLRLACAELLDGLDRAAESVSRLAGRHSWPREFHHLYSDLKSGDGDLSALTFCDGEAERSFKKMEKHVSEVSRLRVATERLAEMEASERRRCGSQGSLHKSERVSSQRQVVQKLKESSLWSERGEKVGKLMGRAVVTIFARLCAVFAPVALELPLVVPSKNGRYRFSQRLRDRHLYLSAPLERPAGASPWGRSSGPLQRHPREYPMMWTSAVLEAPSGTLGGSGLALRYANVVTAASRMLEAGDGEGREELYGLLPSGVRGRVGAKLRGYYCRGEVGEGEEEEKEAWRVAALRILEWLGPVAEDTERWYEARSCCVGSSGALGDEGRSVLALQTLVFSDREKAEAAIVELLVALSCAWRCERRRSVDGCMLRHRVGWVGVGEGGSGGKEL